MKKTYTKAVSATLASALAVGMVPAMALADEVTDAELDLLNQTTQDSVAKGEIVAFNTAAQAAATNNVFVAGTNTATKATALIPLKVKGDNGTATYDVLAYEYYEVKSKVAGGVELPGYTYADGSKIYVASTTALTSAPTAVGSYVVVASQVDVDDDGSYDATKDTATVKAAAFSIAAASLSSVSFYEVDGEDPDDYSDVSFDFKGDEYAIGAADGQLQLKSGETKLDMANFQLVATYDANWNPVDSNVGMKYAGTYYVEYKPIGVYAGQANIKVPVVINVLDLTKAPVKFLDDDTIVTAGQRPVIETVGGIDVTTFQTSWQGAASDLGNKTVTFEYKGTDPEFAASVSGKATATYDVVAQEGALAADYNGARFGTYKDEDGKRLVVDRSAANYKEFSTSNIADVDYIYNNVTVLDDMADGWKLVYEMRNEDNEWVESSLEKLQDASIYGMFRVKAVVDAAANGHQYAGATQYMYIETTNGTVDGTTVAYLHNGAVTAAGFSVDYDATDVMEDMGVVVKTDKGVNVTADCTVTIKKQDPVYVDVWNKVDEIVEVGTYEISVSSTKYKIPAGNTIKITVDPESVDAWPVDPMGLAGWNKGKTFYTGKVIDPVAKFTTVKAVDGKNVNVDVEFDVPASAYTVKITGFTPEGKKTPATVLPTEIKEAGTYTLAITDVDGGNVIVNPANVGYTLVVSTAGPFTDVPSDAWYAESVYAAKEAGIVNGYEGTTLFGPNNAVTRGQFVTMLWNLATGTIEDGSTSSITIIGTKSFSDVSETAYYAKAVAWAKQAKIANGDAGKDTFRPEDSMTRQEGIAFIANFAAAYGVDVDVLAADVAAELAKYPDGAKVSGWAKECVAWACINDVAGNGAAINPQGTITRAEAAAMLVNYKGSFID